MKNSIMEHFQKYVLIKYVFFSTYFDLKLNFK